MSDSNRKGDEQEMCTRAGQLIEVLKRYPAEAHVLGSKDVRSEDVVPRGLLSGVHTHRDPVNLDDVGHPAAGAVR